MESTGRAAKHKAMDNITNNGGSGLKAAAADSKKPRVEKHVSEKREPRPELVAILDRKFLNDGRVLYQVQYGKSAAGGDDGKHQQEPQIS